MSYWKKEASVLFWSAMPSQYELSAAFRISESAVLLPEDYGRSENISGRNLLEAALLGTLETAWKWKKGLRESDLQRASQHGLRPWISSHIPLSHGWKQGQCWTRLLELIRSSSKLILYRSYCCCGYDHILGSISSTIRISIEAKLLWRNC